MGRNNISTPKNSIDPEKLRRLIEEIKKIQRTPAYHSMMARLWLEGR
jgi:hypothetical protein